MQLIHLFPVLMWLCALFYEIKLTHSAKLRCYKGRVDNFDEVSLKDAASLLKSKCYKKDRYNHFYAFGYDIKANGTDPTTVIEALLSLNKRNVFLLNWEKEAMGLELNNITEVLTYPEVVLYQISTVGTEFGEALWSMIKAGMDPNRIHLIGHSLGAQLCGFSGKKLVEYKINLDRITGLEPAGPFFDNPPVMKPLTKHDAKFVDCIHTDYGVFGTNRSLCHTDTFISKNKEHVQPGCPVGDFVPLSPDSLCSHNRCWKLYAYSIYFPNTLIGSHANNFTQWLGCEGDNSNLISIGINVDRSKSGNYYIWITNPIPPYGQGIAGINPSYC